MSTLSSAVGQHYAFASGRTGVLKQLLISSADVDRMLGSSDTAAFSRVLTEVRFTNVIAQGLSSSDDILPALEQWIRSEVTSMIPKEKQEIFGILWVDGDAPLLSWLLKKHYGLTLPDAVKPHSGLSLWSESELLALIQAPEKSSLPKELKDLVTRCAALPEKRARNIDASTAQAIAAYKLRLAKLSGSKHIVSYVRNLFDFTNIRTALRGDVVATDQLLPGGELRIEKARNQADVKSMLNTSGLLGLGGVSKSVLEDPVVFERAIADKLAALIADMWSVPMSVEPVFAFAAIALSHVALIRGIGMGKRAGLSPQDIKKILPPFIPSSAFRS
ncbi:MAG: V-type ATPase subunit [Candidatus Peribacteraceae bacterium]